MLKRLGCLALMLALSACVFPSTGGQNTSSNGGLPAPTDGQLTPPAVTYDAPRIVPEDAYARIQQGENIVILDVRGEESYKTQHIKGALNIPWAKLEQGYSQLPKDRFILLYCT